MPRIYDKILYENPRIYSTADPQIISTISGGGGGCVLCGMALEGKGNACLSSKLVNGILKYEECEVKV